MQMKIKASAPPDDCEGPARVARIEVAGIPGDRLKSELQRLVAPLDISTATVGQVRGQLEASLGLEAGTLSASRRIKRWLGAVLQHEVFKKAQRGPDCERIVRALSACGEYPDSCRQMLVEGLPSALIYNGECALHPHQVRLLEMAHSTISEARNRVCHGKEESIRHAASAEGVLQRLQDTCNAAMVERSKVADASDAMIGRQKASEKELEEAKERVSRVKHEMKQAVENLPELERMLALGRTVSKSHLGTLVHGTWANSDAKDQAVSAVGQFLKDELKRERSLAVTLTDALTCRPAERTPFLIAVAEAASAAVSRELSAIEERLRRSKHAQEEARLTEAQVAYDAVLSRAANDMIAVADAREILDAASAVCQVHRTEVEQQKACVEKHVAEQASADAKIDEFAEVLALIERLMVGPCPKPDRAVNCTESCEGDGSGHDSSGANGGGTASSGQDATFVSPKRGVTETTYEMHEASSCSTFVSPKRGVTETTYQVHEASSCSTFVSPKRGVTETTYQVHEASSCSGQDVTEVSPKSVVKEIQF